MEKDFVKKLTNYVISLGSLENDLDPNRARFSNERRARNGFNQTNFERACSETNIDGRLLFNLIQIDIALYALYRHYCNKDDAEMRKAYVDMVIEKYLLSADFRFANEKFNELNRRYNEIRIDVAPDSPKVICAYGR